jgi:hypothetical protein
VIIIVEPKKKKMAADFRLAKCSWVTGSGRLEKKKKR